MTKRTVEDAIDSYKRSYDTLKLDNTMKEAAEEFRKAGKVVKLDDTMKEAIKGGNFFQRQASIEFMILVNAQKILSDPKRFKEALKEAVTERDGLTQKITELQDQISAAKSLSRQTRVRK